MEASRLLPETVPVALADTIEHLDHSVRAAVEVRYLVLAFETPVPGLVYTAAEQHQKQAVEPVELEHMVWTAEVVVVALELSPLVVEEHHMMAGPSQSVRAQHLYAEEESSSTVPLHNVDVGDMHEVLDRISQCLLLRCLRMQGPGLNCSMLVGKCCYPIPGTEDL